jgi:alkyl hydroperoxide reductase subunit AhpC
MLYASKNDRQKGIMAKKILTAIQGITGLQTKNAIIPLTWKNTSQEHIKQSAEEKKYYQNNSK